MADVFGVLNAGSSSIKFSLFADRGGELVWADEIPGVRRFHTSDPVGNRVEFQAQR